MDRGALITVALPGDLGKPRPAVVIQADLYARRTTVLVIPFTSHLLEADAFRFTVEPAPTNGLKITSQAMLDKIAAAPRAKCGPAIGRLTDAQMTELTRRVVALIGAG